MACKSGNLVDAAGVRLTSAKARSGSWWPGLLSGGCGRHCAARMPDIVITTTAAGAQRRRPITVAASKAMETPHDPARYHPVAARRRLCRRPAPPPAPQGCRGLPLHQPPDRARHRAGRRRRHHRHRGAVRRAAARHGGGHRDQPRRSGGAFRRRHRRHRDGGDRRQVVAQGRAQAAAGGACPPHRPAGRAGEAVRQELQPARSGCAPTGRLAGGAQARLCALAGAVVDGLRGVHPALEARFDAVQAEALALWPEGDMA